MDEPATTLRRQPIAVHLQSQTPRAITPMMTYRFFPCRGSCSLHRAVFFAAGIADDSVSSFNILPWLIVVTCLGSTVTGGGGLNAKAQRRTSTTLPSVLAVPGIPAAIFILSVIVFQLRWN